MIHLFFFFLDSRQQSANSTDEAGNTSRRSRARCLLQTPDCPQHTEYACGLQRSERMGMNNKRCYDNAEGCSASVLLFLHLSRMHKGKRRRNKINIFREREKKKKRVTETLTFCILGDPSGCFHPEFKRIGQHNDFKSLLCQNEYYTEERRRSKGGKKLGWEGCFYLLGSTIRMKVWLCCICLVSLICL